MPQILDTNYNGESEFKSILQNMYYHIKFGYAYLDHNQNIFGYNLNIPDKILQSCRCIIQMLQLVDKGSIKIIFH